MKKLVLVLMALGFLSSVYAEQMYVFQTGNMKVGDKEVKVYLGSPVETKAEVGKDSKVILEGYLDANKLYSNESKALLIAEIPEGVKTVQKDKKVQIEGLIAKENLTKEASEVWEEHEEFYFEMCTQCHAAHDTKEHVMLEWDAILGTMSNFAQLDKEENDYISRYLRSNASDGLYPKVEEKK